MPGCPAHVVGRGSRRWKKEHQRSFTLWDGFISPLLPEPTAPLPDTARDKTTLVISSSSPNIPYLKLILPEASAQHSLPKGTQQFSGSCLKMATTTGRSGLQPPPPPSQIAGPRGICCGMMGCHHCLSYTLNWCFHSPFPDQPPRERTRCPTCEATAQS